MGKIRRRHSAHAIGPPSAELSNGSPGRIPGATITAWKGPPEIDVTAFFARTSFKLSVAGSSQGGMDAPLPGAEQTRTICLSDGTEITFDETRLVAVRTTA